MTDHRAAVDATDATTEVDARLRALVLGYLDDHPTAMDTLDGIAEWWVLRQQIEIEVRRVSHVLMALVADGLLEVHEQGGIRFYRRRPDVAATRFAAHHR